MCLIDARLSALSESFATLELPVRQAGCCDQGPSCPTLEAHLRTIWPSGNISAAVKMKEGENVLARRLHEFEPRTNDFMLL